jgi:hypothetical protein
LLFGGQMEDHLGTHIYSDLWGWNGTVWSLLDSGAAVSPRWAGAMAFDSLRNRAVVFGGAAQSFPGYAPDTLEWDGTRWHTLKPPVQPPYRIDTAMAYDQRRGRTVLFGGWSAGPDGLLWRHMGVGRLQLVAGDAGELASCQGPAPHGL